MTQLRNWLLGATLVLCAAPLFGGGKSNPAPSPPGVAAALIAESQTAGDAVDRRALLAAARSADDAPAAWWQSGFVQREGTWLPLEAASAPDAEKLRRYQVRRAAALPNAVDQLKLADWCREEGLSDQERVHLSQALMTGGTSNPAALLRRLGYRQVGHRWYTVQELKATAEELARIGKEWKRLAPRLEKLALRLDGKPAQRLKATEELRAVTTLAAIPVWEFALAARSEAAAAAVTDVLSEINSYRASHALARLAIGSPWDSVRRAATDELKQRPWEEFVPLALAMMHLPVEMKLVTGAAQKNIIENPEGGREWRFLFTREGRDVIELAALRVIDCRFIPRRETDFRDLDSNRDLAQQLLSQDTFRASLDVYQNWLETADELNARGEVANQHAGELLQAVSGESGDSPEAWWDWWDKLSDAPLSGAKSVVIVRETLRKIEAPIRKSCLAAGTPVWTETGFRPIEEIKVGDRVLAKNIETGELRYQPVLRTTRRENAPLTNLAVGDETIAASQGHNFWISGRGWTRTNQLQPGMTAHTATGTVRLAVADAGRTADVYNLVVADFHTYFVGNSLLLGHDVLIPAPSDMLVPGLTPELTAAK